MPDPHSFPKIRRKIVALLKEGLARHRFLQYGSSAYFIRDRNRVRDAMFFQKMRSNAITIAYGVSTVPEGEWSPGLCHAKWLADQNFYTVKYVEHVESSIGKALADFEREALPWFEKFRSSADVLGAAEPSIRGSAAEPGAAPDRGRHAGFSGFDVSPGGPGR
jgi:hypothetical protein